MWIRAGGIFIYHEKKVVYPFLLEGSCFSVLEGLRKGFHVLAKDCRGGRMGKGRKKRARRYDHIVRQVNLLTWMEKIRQALGGP